MKILKLICKALLFGSIFICLFPLVVFADNSYYSYTANNCFIAYDVVASTGTNPGYHLYQTFKTNVNCRAVCIYDETNEKAYMYYVPENYSVSDSTRKYFRKSGMSADPLSSCPVASSSTSMNNIHITSSSDKFYAARDTISAYPSNCTLQELISALNVPAYPIDTENFQLYSNYPNEQAYEYTYGNYVPEPTPEPIAWGSVRDPEYSTHIAGSGSAAKQNVDVLRWNKEIDTNGNDISECEIEIQAVPGSWSDSTLQGLLNQAVNAFNSTGVQPVTLDTVPADDGLYNCSWQRIINTLNWNFDYLLARETQADLWEKYGWYYRIRLLSPDGYVGQWQTLYTPLSSGAQDSETVINHNSFDMSVNQVYQNLTQLNNNTSITIVYNETDYTIQNPDNGTEPTGGTNLWDILKELLNGIFQILAKLGDLVVGLIDNLFDLFRSLFTPPEVSNEVNNDINLNINNYITESQPGLQDQQLHLHQIFNDLDSISSAYSSGGDCVLQWDDVAMDLSAFNAGNVVFIPGGTYDFKAAFMQLLAGFGMTYATYQMLVSGVIYILLFVLISHKVKGFLKKT